MSDKIELNIKSKELDLIMRECISKRLTSVVDCAISHESLSNMLSRVYNTIDISGALKRNLQNQIDYCMQNVVMNFMEQTDFQSKMNTVLVEYLESEEGKEVLKGIAIRCLKS